MNCGVVRPRSVERQEAACIFDVQEEGRWLDDPILVCPPAASKAPPGIRPLIPMPASLPHPSDTPMHIRQPPETHVPSHRTRMPDVGSSQVKVMLRSLSSGRLKARRMDSVNSAYPAMPARTSKL